MQAFRRFSKQYDTWLQTRPILTKTATAVVMAAAGDVVCQHWEGGKSYNFARTLRMGAMGAVVTPLIHHWYNFLVARFPHSPVQRMIADQAVWAPVSFVGYLYMLAFLETGGFSTGTQKVKDTWWPVMKGNWMVWPAVQFVNFSYVPLPYQVLFVNAVSFFWSIFLSKMANRDTDTSAYSP